MAAHLNYSSDAKQCLTHKLGVYTGCVYTGGRENSLIATMDAKQYNTYIYIGFYSASVFLFEYFCCIAVVCRWLTRNDLPPKLMIVHILVHNHIWHYDACSNELIKLHIQQ